MKRQRNKDNIWIKMSRYFYVSLIIAMLFSFTYAGKLVIGIIVNAEIFNNQNALELNGEHEDMEEEVGTRNELEVELEEEGEDLSEIEQQFVKERTNDVNNDLGVTIPHKSYGINPEDLPSLSELHNGRQSVNIDVEDASWYYTYYEDDGSGVLNIVKGGTYTLQNNEDGSPTETSIPLHILVTADVDDDGLHIMLHNMNINRPGRIDSSNPNLGESSVDNAPFFITSENVTLMLAEGTTNYVDAVDSMPGGIQTIRSAIYMYGETEGYSYTLNVTGTGSLVTTGAGIVTHVVENSMSNIIITNSDIDITIDNKLYHPGIATAGRGNSNIEIKDAKINIDISQDGIARMNQSAPGIGGSPLSGSINSTLSIKISGISHIIINMSGVNEISNNSSLHNVNMSAASIGTGEEAVFKSIIIQIVGNPVIETMQLIRGANRIGDLFFHSANIGIGRFTQCIADLTITIDGGKISASQVVDVRRTGHTDIARRSSTMRSSVIGIGYGTTVQNATISISGGNVNLEQKFMAFNVNGDPVIGINNVTGTAIGSSSNLSGGTNAGELGILDINLTGGNIVIKLGVETDNPDLIFDAEGAGIGSAASLGSKIGSIINVNISGDIKIDVQGGHSGIGTAVDSEGEVNVNISRDASGNVPNLLVTARSGEAIMENNAESDGLTEGVIISQLDLSDDRTGDSWTNWDDTVEKDMIILQEQDDLEVGRRILHKVHFIDGIRGIAYTLPSLEEETDTLVKLIFTNHENGIITGYLQKKDENRVITANDVIHSEEVFFFDTTMPPLWTLHDEGDQFEDGIRETDSWIYTHNTGTLRLTEADFFVLRNNNEAEEDFKEEVPMNIIVEPRASGSEIVLNNMDIIRSNFIEDAEPHHIADSELIAPFMIKSRNTTIRLNQGTNNKINGADPLLEEGGYRSSMYLYASDDETYDLNIMLNENFRSEDSVGFTTVNGGVNVVGVSGATVNMTLADGDYNLSSIGANNNYGAAFGSGYVPETDLNFDLNLSLSNPNSVRAVGNNVAIGHNKGSSGINNLDYTGEFELTAFAFSDGNAISSESFSNPLLEFTSTLDRNDNWDSIIMRPYIEDNDLSDHWKLALPDSSSYLEEIDQKVTVVYSNPEFAKLNDINPFERMSLRISVGDNMSFLANINGTGTTVPLLSEINGSNVYSLIPSDPNFNIEIPRISLETDISERTLSMLDNETRSVENNSALPLAIFFGGYELIDYPNNVEFDSFAINREQFDNVDGEDVEKILLELFINKAEGSGDVIFNDGQEVQTLYPREANLEERNYTEIVTLRGVNSEKEEAPISVIDLFVNGEFTEAMGANVSGNFLSTIYLGWSLRHFVEF